MRESLLSSQLESWLSKDEDADFVKKFKSTEFALPNKIEEADDDESSFEELESSQQQDYIFEVDSPISTEDDDFDDFIVDDQDNYEDTSMEDLNDINIEKGYESIGEEEIKLPSNNSDSILDNNSAEEIDEPKLNVIGAVQNQSVKAKTLRGSFKMNKNKIQSIKKVNQQKKTKKKKQKREELKKAQTYVRAAGRRNSKFVSKEEIERQKREHDRLLGINVDDNDLYKDVKEELSNECDEEYKEELKEELKDNLNEELKDHPIVTNNQQYKNQRVSESEDERSKREQDRKKLIEKLRKDIQLENQKIKDGEIQSQDDTDLIKRLQMKVMLVTKHPDIKDQTKKIRVTNWKFKYKSLNDVYPPEEPRSPQPVKESIWRRMLRGGDAKEFEKKIRYKAKDDINIPIEDDSNESIEGEDNATQKDVEYTSKNKLLQKKYNEGFLSNIVSTGTISIVTEYTHHKVINRTKMLITEEKLSEGSEVDISKSKVSTFKVFEQKLADVFYK